MFNWRVRNHVWCHDDTCFNENTVETQGLFDPSKVCAYRGQTVVLYNWAVSVCGQAGKRMYWTFCQMLKNERTCTNSQNHIQIFHKSSWPWRKRLHTCPATCGDNGPMSLRYSFNSPGQLKNWLRVKGVSPKLYFFGRRVPPSLVSLCSTRPHGCRNLLNLLLLLDATGLSAALPSTRQGMHPWVALETSTRRRMSLVQNSSCCRVSPSYRHPRTFRWNRTRCGGGTCRNKRRHIHHCWSRYGHNFFFFMILKPLRHCAAACQAEVLGTTSGAEMADIEQMKKIVPLITCEIAFNQHVCELVFGVNVTHLNFWVQLNPVK